VALDLDSGKIKGHHQYHQNDAWDWDEVSAPLLIDTEINGRKVKGAVHAGRNGYLWMLDRQASGKIDYVNGVPYVYNDVFKSIDKKTGRPTYDDSKKPGMGKAVTFCPSLWGGKDWPPEAWSPKTKLFYIPANNHLCSELPAAETAVYKKGDLYIGYPIDGVLGSLRYQDGKKTRQHWRTSGLELGHRKDGLDLQVRPRDLGASLDHRWQSVVCRWHQRPNLPCV